ncbi:MAG: single-stranded DNA-binding protein [Bacteroidota bacterium]|nr:single-stranded DNA-binding protein [Bacteroidota bacterium]
MVWRCLATFANQYIHNGSLLYKEGKLRHRQYENKDGQNKYVTKVVADAVVLMDRKGSDK